MNNLKMIRMIKGKTKQSLAKMLNISQKEYTQYENGEKDIELSKLNKLADYYEMSIDFITGRRNGDLEFLSPKIIEIIQLLRELDDAELDKIKEYLDEKTKDTLPPFKNINDLYQYVNDSIEKQDDKEEVKELIGMKDRIEKIKSGKAI